MAKEINLFANPAFRRSESTKANDVDNDNDIDTPRDGSLNRDLSTHVPFGDGDDDDTSTGEIERNLPVPPSPSSKSPFHSIMENDDNNIEGDSDDENK